mmetsp:Transcript_605/g.1099  ORF Transcript_605/g.1099 Transcript_605/m.1099 type:complete len:333 (-) Transcript_605:134-1132(-)|eukprot:CAMPEP_0176489734 /NCGR_PEP_ID=MMETSP0200_2-20121128/7464_1 /TAXON_ID=947934 /ORGANISM="Chaetoceros sp., Strain GSL56" /LENGTH=332 /DNA_ID=CAMNT_0017886931 /DNA_START=101 /DNA_END=1099 /DNA_ORIENTATION=+
MLKFFSAIGFLVVLASFVVPSGAFLTSTTIIGGNRSDGHVFSKMPSKKRKAVAIIKKNQSTNHLNMNFFKDMIESAFKNDPNLSSSIEGPNDSEEHYIGSPKTDVQKKWLQSQDKMKNNNVFNDGKGAPLKSELLEGTNWKIGLYLMGVPNFDPTNSLYGSKVNISNRDSQLVKDGFAIGADVLPDDPTLMLQIKLLKSGKCKVETSSFTTGEDGEWKLSDDGRLLRFSLDCTGYQRIITTKGTIQNVYWSNRDEAERKSSAVYEIAPGKVYGEARVSYGEKPGVYVMGSKAYPDGLLKIEKAQGLFGVSTKMVACGKFAAEMILGGEEKED